MNKSFRLWKFTEKLILLKGNSKLEVQMRIKDTFIITACSGHY